MADIQTAFSFVAGLVFLLGFIPYIHSILKGKTKPSKASWIIWGSLDVITLAGMFAEGTLNGQIVGAVLGAGTVALLSLKYGTAGWTKLDIFCLVGAVSGVVLWALFQNPIFGIVVSQVIIFTGSMPTFLSAWEDPSREDKTAWSLYWFSCVLAIVGIPEWSLSNAAQPLTFFVIESVMMVLLFAPRTKTA